MAWRRRNLARATSAQIAATAYALGEPIVNKDAGAEKGRLSIGDGVTAGGKPLAFKAEVDAVSDAFTGHDHVPGDITGLDEYLQDLVAAMLQAGSNVTLTYNDATGKLEIAAAGSAGASRIGALVNLGLSASVGSNALTISLVSADGSALSGINKATIPFRSATAASGVLTHVDVTAPLSLTISAGSTLGFANGVPGKLWVVAFNDGGTVRPAAINCRSGQAIFPLGAFGVASSTAEGGAGAADSAHVFYSAAAVAAKSFAVLGYLEWPTGLATAGQWSAAPGRVHTQQLADPLPGHIVQTQHVLKTDTFTSSTAGVLTDVTGLSVSITPTSAANLIKVSTHVVGQGDTTANLSTLVLRRDSANIGGGAAAGSRTPAIGAFPRVADGRSISSVASTIWDAPGTTAATTYKVQFVLQTGGTIAINRTWSNPDVIEEPRTCSGITLEEYVS